MASLRRDARNGKWDIFFRWQGKQFCKSCNTKKKAEADAVKNRVEDTIRFLKLGRLEIPREADPGVWILSEGKLLTKTSTNIELNEKSRFEQICDLYFKDQLSKAGSTLGGEKVHLRHLKRVLGTKTLIHKIDLEDLQKYVNQRSREKYRKRPISGKTIRKELVTFHQVWSWAKERKYVESECPIYNDNHRWGVNIPKSKEKLKFQTWEQIERQIKRGGISNQQKQELWTSLFLNEKQVVQLLRKVKEEESHPFIHPMFVFAAYTGVRRGELLRSRIEDFDFHEGMVMIRERKRRKDMEQTFRFVPIHPQLEEIMKSWFKQHPGGPFTLCLSKENSSRSTSKEHTEMGVYQAHYYFKQVLKNSKWNVVRGFHVLRHSFGSNLARSGQVSRDTIAEWMGHTTEEMKSLYQHLFPQDGKSQISVLK